MDDIIHTELPRSREVAVLAEMFSKMENLDYVTGVSPSQRTHTRYGLDRPEAMLKLVEHTLRRAGYYGPYVIVAHDGDTAASPGRSLSALSPEDDGRSHYYHAHIMIHESAELGEIRRLLRRLGAIPSREEGPIRSFAAFVYLANRACPNGHGDSDLYIFEDHWRRRRRPRGLRHRKRR